MAQSESPLLRVAYTKDFKRDFDRLHIKQVLSPEFTEVMYCLQRNQPLPPQYKDHPLKGDKKEYRDCHIFHDLVLIYKIENDVLTLIRVNTHSEVF